MPGYCGYFSSRFLSTPSARRATAEKADSEKEELKFLSTPSARRATSCCKFLRPLICISIHALREEGDVVLLCYLRTLQPISIHALREEGDYPCCQSRSWLSSFLSTPSARRATTSYPQKYQH